MASTRWTKNPTLPKRYRPGKGEDVPSDDEYSEEEEDDVQLQESKSATKPKPAVKAAPRSLPTPKESINEDDFETESEGEGSQKTAKHKLASALNVDSAGGSISSEEGEEEESEEGSEEESEESDTSSEDEAPKLMRPVFIRKDQREKTAASDEKASTTAARAAYQPLSAQSGSNAPEEARERRTEADAIVQEQLEKQAAARAAGRKYWDDDDDNLSDEVDDTDGLDPEAELAAWKLRELKRVKRARDAIEAAEKEREEIERRRALTAEEREREDAERLEKQREEREGRGQAGYMKRYMHRGAFYQDRDDDDAEALRNRDIMGARFADEVNREVLPEYMQIRDMTKLGRKGRSKYKDLRSEDTGRWGQDSGHQRDRWMGDERFASDGGRSGTGPERSGANAAPIGSRYRARSRSRDSRKRSRSPLHANYDRGDKRARRVEDR